MQNLLIVVAVLVLALYAFKDYDITRPPGDEL